MVVIMWHRIVQSLFLGISYNINIFFSEIQASLAVLEESTTQLWWAGKEITRGKKLSDFIGKNEKTAIIAKLQKVTKLVYIVI